MAEDLRLRPARARWERQHVQKALNATGGNVTRAAKLLGISLRCLQFKLAQWRKAL